MATRKTNIKRKTNTAANRRRKTTARKSNSRDLASFFVPLFFIICIVFCLGFLFFMGYKTVTASEFFNVKMINVEGAKQSSTQEIENIVKRETEKTGVWNADLEEIRQNVEKINFVKIATVSRVLPNGVRVNLTEREPIAVVRLDSGDFWVDKDAAILKRVGEKDERHPFFLQGWNEERTEKAKEDNVKRVKIYMQMLDEWRDFEIAKRVSAVDMRDIRDVEAFVEDSGENVKIIFRQDDYGTGLKKSLEAIAGKGDEIKSAIWDGRVVTTQLRKG